LYGALGEALKLRVKRNLIDLWAELLAENAALDEVAQEFGEDVLKPASRADLDRAREKLQQATPSCRNSWATSSCPR
jgi:hypothetical protein